MFSITILGSGTSVPTAHRNPPAYLVRASGVDLLLDCGSGASSALVRAGVGLSDLHGILLTHLHPDHCADLVPLLFALANPLGPRRSMDLPLWGPAGTGDHLRALQGLYGRWIQPLERELLVQDLSPGQDLSVGPVRVTPHAVEHSGASLAYRVACAGRSVCFSGDSGPCEGLQRAAAGADLFVCECSKLEDDDSPGHMKASDVGRAAAAAGCGRVLLTHLYPHIEHSDPAARVRQHYDGPVALAEDGMVVDLTVL
jgi:ribonuclease BN (tRNA processing enzyme)